MEADTSRITTEWRDRLVPAESTGWTAAATSTAAARSCSRSSQLKRSRCHGTLAWRSRIWSGQRFRAGTTLVGLQIRKKYSATMAGRLSARTAANGAGKVTATATLGDW